MSPRVTPENRIPDIITAAVEVFSHRGFRLAQMEEIAKAANVSKATLYYYFKSKVHLFYYVMENAGRETEAGLPPPESASIRNETDLLRLLKRRLKADTRFKSIEAVVERESSDIDLDAEIAAIIEELWDICEKNRIQIIILEKSAFEYPELAETYDRYARGQILRQLEQYLTARMRHGVIRPLHSIPATARFIVESVAWFGFKQTIATAEPIHPKAETLPDIAAILSKGLKQ